MRVMIDTNVLISVFVFKSMRLGQMLDFIGTNHDIVLCSYVLDELREVVDEKFSEHSAALDEFLEAIPFEYFFTPRKRPEQLPFTIRDKGDMDVLYSAILSGVDTLVTGDKDFWDIEVEGLQILKPAMFIAKYMEPYSE